MGFFARLRDRLDRMIDGATVPQTPRETAAALREALLEWKVGLDDLRRARQATEGELAVERRQLADAERRGALAAEIPDPETVRVAGEFAERHRERVAVLERKLAVQGDEIVLAEREGGALTARFQEARRGLGDSGMAPSVNAAWRDVEAAGGTRPELDLDHELLQHQADRAARDQAADLQLQALKKKLGKDPR
ncbi:MAG TPA: hypothetical protein VFI39_03600 [Gemmatimonadales bacterium]|nr:hypothetical protein [Gemmatimonadales bacterium]